MSESGRWWRTRPRLLLCIAASLTLLAALPAEAASPAHGVAADANSIQTQVRVAGNSLVDGGGRTVALHGVNISGTEFACAQGGVPGREGWSIFGGQPVDSAATIGAMQSWHINAVRVPLNEDCWLGINGINPRFGGHSYVTAVTQFIHHLRSNGMYVIIDLHWSAPGGAVALSQQPMADEDHSIAFWSDVAATFRTDLGVVFDLYNEPFLYATYMQGSSPSSWSCWLAGCMLSQYLTGGHPYTRPLAWRAAGMQELLDAVRATGATNVVLASGLNWADDDSGWLTHRPVDPVRNVAAGWHEYGGEACSAVACWSSTIAPLARKVPIVVSETGDHAGTGCSLINLPNFLPWADRNGLSYLAWTFNPWHDSHDVLITNWNGTPTPCEGEYYSSHLTSIAANPPAVHPDIGQAPLPAPGLRDAAPKWAERSAMLMLLIAVVAWGVFLMASTRRNRASVKRMSPGGSSNSFDASTRLRVVRVLSVGAASIATLMLLMLLYVGHPVR